VIQPILERRAALIRDVTASNVLDAEARKRVALTELRDIEYDYLGGKLDETDYQALRERISVEALQAIRAAEALKNGAAKPAANGGVAVADDANTAVVTHACGYANPAGSRFCGGCGQGLA
jgi:hypothetical protein